MAPPLKSFLGQSVPEMGLTDLAAIDTSAWQDLSFELKERFDGELHFRAPSSWRVGMASDGRAVLAEGDSPRVSIFVMPVDAWTKGLDGFLKSNEIVGFAVQVLLRESYLRWVLVTRPAEGRDTWWVWSVYTAGTWLLLAKGDARTPAELTEQLAFAVQSSPWSGWIAQARRQRELLDRFGSFAGSFAFQLFRRLPAWAAGLGEGNEFYLEPPGAAHPCRVTIADGEITVCVAGFHGHFGWPGIDENVAIGSALAFLEELARDDKLIAELYDEDGKMFASQAYSEGHGPRVDAPCRIIVRSFSGRRDAEYAPGELSTPPGLDATKIKEMVVL